MVVKDKHGGHGNDNYFVQDSAELATILAKNPQIRFIAQEFIPNDRDYRILLAGSQALIIERRGQAGSHLNNTSQGGTATLIDPDDFPAELVEAARAYATWCQYEIAGVDVVMNVETGKYYFLEINSQPQIVTGAFVPEKQQLIGQYLRQLLG